MEHEWKLGSELGFDKTSYLHKVRVCQKCGVLRREDGFNSDCKGKVRVGFREAKQQQKRT